MNVRYIVLLIFCTQTLWAQNQNSPSILLKQLATAKEDTVITDLYNQLGQYYFEEKYDSAYYYFNKGLAIARQRGIQSEIAYLLISKARIIIYEGEYQNAIDTLKKALAIFKQENLIHASGTANTSIGVVFYNRSQYDSCKYYWNKSLGIYKELNDSSGLATIYSNIGVVNYVQGNAEIALKNYLKSLEIRKKIKSTNALASVYMKIALIYQTHFKDYVKSYEYVSEAVDIYRKENNKLGETKALINKGNALEILDSTKRAFETYNKALIRAEEIGNKRLLATIYSVLGKKLTTQHKYKEALNYLYKSLNYNDEMGQIRELSENYNSIGIIFYQLADYNTALSYYQKSLELADKLDLHSQKMDLYYSLSDAAAKMNNFKKAYVYHQNYVIEKDSVSRHENKDLLADLEAKYANQKNQQKIEFLEKEQKLKDYQLKQSKTISNVLIVMGLVVLILALLYYQRFRQKSALSKELKKRNDEIKLANTEIKQKSDNIESFNKLLMDKNSLIQQQNQEMAASNETKDRIISIIGHDLRSPMVNIHTSLSLLKTKDFASEKVDYLYHLMDNDINSTMDLLENLLIWVKKQEGRMKLQKDVQEFNSVAEKVVNSLIGIANNKEIELSYLKAENDIAYFDKPMISAVLRNLVNNAIKFTRQGGTIQISVSQKDNFLHISVADNGIGMDESTIEKITQKASHYSQPGTNKEKGSGLGLSLCFDIIEMHKGVLNIESQPEKGSVFTFTIPVKSID